MSCVIISHRGNLYGSDSRRENVLTSLDEALSNDFHVEADVWHRDGKFWLGHDKPTTPVTMRWLSQPGVWVHAKDVATLYSLYGVAHVFYHEQDKVAITSKGFFWNLVGGEAVPRSVIVLPERHSYSDEDIRRCYAICTDSPFRYRELNRCE